MKCGLILHTTCVAANIIPNQNVEFKTFLDKEKLNFQISVKLKGEVRVLWLGFFHFGCQIRVEILLFRVEIPDFGFPLFWCHT